MFLGTHYNRIDEKGRLTLPASFRRAVQDIGKDCYIAPSPSKPCLVVFQENGGTNTITEDTAPLCQAISPDTTGRFVLKQAFRIALNSTTETPDSVVTVGRRDYFEIWTTENWQQEKQKLHQRLLSNSAPSGTE